MKNTMVDLWNGNLAPVKKCTRDSAQIASMMALIEKRGMKLSAVLDEKQMELFAGYNACMEEYLGALAEQAFCEGFRLGARLLSEVFGESS